MKQNAISESILCISKPNFIASKNFDHKMYIMNNDEKEVSKDTAIKRVIENIGDKYSSILVRAVVYRNISILEALSHKKGLDFKKLVNTTIENFIRYGLEEETDFLLTYGSNVEYIEHAAYCALEIRNRKYTDKLISKIPDLHNIAFLALDTKQFSYLEELRLSGKVGIEDIMSQLTAYDDIEYKHYFAYLASVNLIDCNVKKNESLLKIYLSNEINAVRFFSALSHEFYINYAHLIDEKSKNIIIRSREVVLNPKKLGMEHINADSAYFYLKEREMMKSGKLSAVGKAAIWLYYPLCKKRTDMENEEFCKVNHLTPICKIPPEIISHIVGMCFKHSERDKFYSENILASVKERVVTEWVEKVFSKDLTVAHSV